jgi:hypothetical protein
MLHRVVSAVIAALLFYVSAAPPASATAQPPATVLVVGGTPAGVAAAVAAARRGDDVTLVAQRPVLGGVLTDAMMDQWDLNLTSTGRTVEGGIFREIYAQLGDSFTPQDAARVFGDLVASEPRIHLITGARPVATRVVTTGTDRSVDEVTFAAGRRTFAEPAAYVIDATDDGDVAALAGARYDVGRQDTGRDELMQPVTLMFTLENVDWPQVAASYDVARDGPGGVLDRRAWGYSRVMADYRPLSSDVFVRDLNFGHQDGGSVTVNAIDVLGIDGRFDAELARARAISEAEAPHLVAFLRERVPGFERAEVGRYADAIYVRETRHFTGLARLTAEDVWSGKVPSDTIGLSSYPLDLHPATATDHAAYAPVRHVYGVPFGTLVPRDFTNLLLASPAISASHIASGSARVIPTTIEEGEAAGAAAAEAADRQLTFPELDARPAAIVALQTDLRRNGVLLPAEIARS